MHKDHKSFDFTDINQNQTSSNDQPRETVIDIEARKVDPSEVATISEQMQATPALGGKVAKPGPGKGIFSIPSRIKSFYGRYKTPINIALVFFAVSGIVIATFISLWLVDVWNNESSLAGLGQQPNQSSVVFASDGTTELYRYFEEENREVVDIDQISENMQLAIIALEDENFYYNDSGIPWSNIVGATVQCAISTGDNCRGASGLSQQLIKNVKKDNESTVDRKVRELFTAIKLNNEVTKDDILELYLNWVPFGRNAYGIEQAAQVYFNKSAADLDRVEACYLASMVQRPSYFNSGLNNPESQAFQDLEARKNACLSKMFTNDLKPGSERLITSQEELTELQETIVEFAPIQQNVKYPHFRDYVNQEIAKFLNEQDLLTGGYRIITSLDPAAQAAAEQSLANRAQDDILSVGANNAAIVVLDGPTGQVKAMVGSLDYNNEAIDGQVNVALSPRQPGSSIKPYVYAASFENGLNPQTVLADVQTTFDGNFTPRNFSGNFVGPVSIRSALANSYNIPAVKAAYLAADGSTPNSAEGIAEVFDFAERAGVEFPCIPAADGTLCDDATTAKDAYRRRCGLSAALGGCEVSMLSHITGINTFAQNGTKIEATPFIQIIDRDGKDIYAERQQSNNPVYQIQERAIDPLVAKQINDILSDYEARRPAFGSSATRLELAGWNGANSVAAKTGTTNDVKDTWTVGYSPYYSVAVWVGNTDSTPITGTGSSVRTTSGIWNDIMVSLHANKEKRGFDTEGLKSIQVDRASGLPIQSEDMTSILVTDAQIERLNKAVENLAKPQEYDAYQNTLLSNMTTVVKRTVKINKLDGKLAVEGKTLPENIEEKTFFELVAEYPVAAWQDPLNRIMENNPNNFSRAPTELSDQDQVADQQAAPTITSNLDGDRTGATEITVTATPQGSTSKTISNIQILIDGDIVLDEDNTTTVTFDDLDGYYTSPHQVVIRATDSLGAASEKLYSGVTFIQPDPTPLTQSEISSLEVTCDEPSAGDTETVCQFDLELDQELPETFRIAIGQEDSVPCEEDERNTKIRIICQDVPIPTSTGEYDIKAKVGNNELQNTDSVFELN